MKTHMERCRFSRSTPWTLALLAVVMTQLTACGAGQNSVATIGTADPGPAQAGTQDEAVPTSTPASTTDGTTVETAAAAVTGTSLSSLTVVIRQEANLTAAQSQKLHQAVTALNQVVRSSDLKQKILDFSYQGKKQFVQNNGLTNEQIYNLLMSGAEKWPKQTAADGIADISMKIYYPPWWKMTSAVAFTTSSDAYLNIYNSYFNGASVPELAQTVFHEWTHKMGFDHDFNATAQRPYSVPYGMGGLINAAVKAYLGN